MSHRLNRLQQSLTEQGIAAVALVPGANLRYLTGLDFHLSKRLTLAFFPAEGTPAFVLPAMEASRAQSGSAVPLDLYPWNDGDEGGPQAALQHCLEALSLSGRRIAAEYTAMRLLELRAIETCLPGVYLEDATPILGALRMRKDAEELAAMDEAARMIETALRTTISQIRSGMTERQIAALWTQEILATGSDGPSFELIVASGPSGAHPHHNNSDRAAQPGDLIILDGGALCRGYASDITRTVAVGEPGAEARRIYELVRAANAAGRAACRPGVTGEQIDAATRRVITDGGYGPQFLHRTGHGLGLEIHEEPYLTGGSTQPLPEGTTFTVEPGIYVEGLGGVRIEDDMVLTTDGARSLTAFERELIVLPV